MSGSKPGSQLNICIKVYLIKITLLVFIFFKLDSNTNIIIQGGVHAVGRRRTGSITGHRIMKVGDDLADGDKLVKELAGDRVEQLLNVLLLIRVLDLVILERGEHLVSSPGEDVKGLAAELLLDETQQGLVGGARLLGLGLVDGVVGEGEDGDLLGGSGAAPALGVATGEVGVDRGGSVALRLLGARLGELLLELGRLVLDGAVAEGPGVDPAPERLGLAGGLVGVPRAGVGGEDEAGVGAVLVLLEPRVRLGAAAEVGHGSCGGGRWVGISRTNYRI